MQPFRVEKLNLEQVRDAYPALLAGTFPTDELKPLGMIERAIQRGEYVCYGALDGENMLGAAFFVTLSGEGGALMLFDYLAVRRELRCRGIGGAFLRALVEGPLADAGAVLLEAEDPAAAGTPEDRRLRERRLGFYGRNGLHDTGATAVVFGVTYRILTLPVGESLSTDAAKRAYARLYHSMLPPSVYRERIFIEGLDAVGD